MSIAASPGGSSACRATRARACCASSTITPRTTCSSAVSSGAPTRSRSGTPAPSSTAPCGTTGRRPARATASPSRATSRSDPRPGGTGAMNKLALAPTTLPDTPALDYVEAAIAGGYDLVGLRLVLSPGLPFHPVLGDAPLIRDVKRRLADSGVGVLDIFSCYLKPDTKLDDFWPALELGAALGGKYVMLMADDADAARLQDNFVAFCAGAARYGLAAAIEFAPMRTLASLAQTVALIQATGVANAVICLDPLSLAR